jgi:hypothetical protein
MRGTVGFFVGGSGGAALLIGAWLFFLTPSSGCACGPDLLAMSWNRMTFVERVIYRWNGTLPEGVLQRLKS